MNFEEIVIHINNAIGFVEKETEMKFEDIIEESYETLPFVAGHIMGMRDAMVMVQNVLQNTMFGNTVGEEE
tara:strand:- start:453 stop:665 length:213 start_codon:yes stop_codon:yes gene_type:complete